MFKKTKKKIAIPVDFLKQQLEQPKGTTILGVNRLGTQLYIIKQTIFENCSEFQLNIHEIDCFNFSISNCIESLHLFSQDGYLNIVDTGMIFQLIEIEDHAIDYIIIGYMPDDQNIFVYFSIILKNRKIINFSFPTNSSTFNWDPHTSLILTDKSASLIASAVSSLKIISFDEEWNPHFKSIDIDKYISRVLKDSTMLLEAYMSKIIANIDGCFYSFIGFVYFSESKQSWQLVCHILKISNDQKITLFNSTAKSLKKRPRGESITKKLENLYQMFESMSRSECLKENIIIHTNTNYKNGIREIKIPIAESCIIDIKRNMKNTNNDFEFSANLLI